MFQLGKREFAALMSQIATSNVGRGGRRKLPYAFTEHRAYRRQDGVLFNVADHSAKGVKREAGERSQHT
jgi:hypothetical protein